MSASRTQEAARSLARKMKVSGTPLATQEGLASGASSAVDTTLGEVVPGVSALQGGSRRIVLVTDDKVHVFAGRRFGRIGEELRSYSVKDLTLRYDDDKLSFPDGLVVYFARPQASDLLAAAGSNLGVARATQALSSLGISGEDAVGVAQGKVPGSERRTVGNKLEDLALWDYEDPKAVTVDPRLVIFSDKAVRVVKGARIASHGEVVETCPVGTDLSIDGSTVSFPLGELVEFASATGAEQVVRVAKLGRVE